MQIVFFIVSFFSNFGDALLYFALPIGISLEKNSLQAAALMFLLPALSMLASTLASKYVQQRLQHARQDYGKLLLSLAGIEIALAFAISHTQKTDIKIILCAIFVVLYAFIKEGLPRLFYNISMYRYFFKDSEYAKAVGIDKGLGIAAWCIGALYAGYLISTEKWENALFIDSSTFIALGITLLWFGKDTVSSATTTSTVIPFLKMVLPRPKGVRRMACTRRTQMSRTTANDGNTIFRNGIIAETDKQNDDILGSKNLKNKYSYENIVFAIAASIAIQSLFWGFIPLTAYNMGIGKNTQYNLQLMTIASLPGLVAGLFFARLSKFISPQFFIKITPFLVTLTSFIFLKYPSILSYVALLIFYGFFMGFYWPADYWMRSHLNNQALISFNKKALTQYAIWQLCGCTVSYFIFKQKNFQHSLILTTAILGATTTVLFKKQRDWIWWGMLLISCYFILNFFYYSR